jgi:ParB/RepB/Spo0J family partition protein
MSHSTHPPRQRIVSLPLTKLHPHPGNPNRISKPKFAALVRHLERTGQYEPLVVRRHPQHGSRYQILNGHHRLRALKQLGHLRADCVIFTADDEQARLYLLNLNRLCGRDNLYKKAKLIEELCRTHSTRDLARHISDSKTAIEKLTALSQNQPLPKSEDKPFRIPMTFFMNEEQHALIAAAFDKAMTSDQSGKRQRISALVRIARDYLEKETANDPTGDRCVQADSASSGVQTSGR